MPSRYSLRVRRNTEHGYKNSSGHYIGVIWDVCGL